MEKEKSNDLPENKIGQEKDRQPEKSQKGFVFYESFEYAISETLSIKNQLIAYKAIVDYGLNFRIPENLPKPVMSILFMAKPQIDRNYKKKLDGAKGEEYGVKGAEYGVSGVRPKKIDVPSKNVPVNNDFREEPEPFDEGCDF